MSPGERMFRVESDDGPCRNEVAAAGQLKISDRHLSKKPTEQFFIEFDDFAGDPANYCLPSDERFPD